MRQLYNSIKVIILIRVFLILVTRIRNVIVLEVIKTR